MQFRRGRDRQRRVLRSVNHGTAVAPREVARGRGEGECTRGKWRVEVHILITIFPRAEHRDPCPRFADHRLPALPLVQTPPLSPPNPAPSLRLTQAACRNLINLPVASRLAPCRHFEILYPSHPLKSVPAVVRGKAPPRRLCLPRHSQSARDYCARSPLISLSFSPFSLSSNGYAPRAVLQIRYVCGFISYGRKCRETPGNGLSKPKTCLCVPTSRHGIISVSSRERRSFRDFAETEILEKLETFFPGKTPREYATRSTKRKYSRRPMVVLVY